MSGEPHSKHSPEQSPHPEDWVAGESGSNLYPKAEGDAKGVEANATGVSADSDNFSNNASPPFTSPLPPPPPPTPRDVNTPSRLQTEPRYSDLIRALHAERATQEEEEEGGVNFPPRLSPDREHAGRSPGREGAGSGELRTVDRDILLRDAPVVEEVGAFVYGKQVEDIGSRKPGETPSPPHRDEVEQRTPRGTPLQSPTPPDIYPSVEQKEHRSTPLQSPTPPDIYPSVEQKEHRSTPLQSPTPPDIPSVPPAAKAQPSSSSTSQKNSVRFASPPALSASPDVDVQNRNSNNDDSDSSREGAPRDSGGTSSDASAESRISDAASEKQEEEMEGGGGGGGDGGGGCNWIPVRYMIVWALFCGMVVVNAMRTNVGVTVLTILDKRTHIINNDTGEIREVPNVDWNAAKIGYLHSIFYLGYLITHLPGGYLTTRLPSHKIFGGCILVSSVLNLCLPVAIELGGYVVTLLVRFTQGLFEGLLYPSCYGIIRHWSTPQERGRVGSLVLTGAYLGPAVGFPIAGVITDYMGWDYIYYVNGGLGVLFVLFWTWLSEEKPAHHSKISHAELEFIEQLQGSETFDYEGQRIPWKDIVTSPPVWTLCLCNIARNWVFILMLTNEPFYLNMFKFTIAQNGAYSALPHLVKMTASLTSGMIADFVLTRKLMSTTKLRKMLTSGFGMQSLMFLLLTLTTDGTVAMVILTSALGFGGFVVSGWQLNHYDLSVRHASVLVAVTSTMGNVASVSAPLVCGYLTQEQTFQGWNDVFYITAFLTATACFSFLLCGSGERQPWAQPPDTACLVIRDDKRRRQTYTPSPSSTPSPSTSTSNTSDPSRASPLSPAHFTYSKLREADDHGHVTHGRGHVPNYGSRETTPSGVLSDVDDSGGERASSSSTSQR